MGKIILTGDRPTGRLHLGHYVGSLRGRVELQNSGDFSEIYIMIADAQALTDNAEDPGKIRESILEVALDYLAAGIDPEKSVVLIQSQISELFELTCYYMNLVTVARLERNPTVKTEIKMRAFDQSIPVGFFTYPISQAADITAFQATTVPVGEDQAPMLEQTREIVHKFNSVYGDTLVMPDILLPEKKIWSRLPGTDGKAKMSKSLGNFFLLREVLDKFPADVVRFYLIATHYRSPLDFDDGKLEEARKALGRLKTTLMLANEFQQDKPSVDDQLEEAELLEKVNNLQQEFIAAMDDDFNTARAIGHLFEISHLINSYLGWARRDNAQDQAVVTKVVSIFQELGEVLGIFIDQESEQGAELEEVLQILAGLRQEARQEKDYALADDIRDFLSSLGINIEDTPAGPRFRYKSAPELKLLMEKLIDLRAHFKFQKRYEKADYIRDSLQKAGIIVEDTREGVRWKIAEA